MKQGVKLPRIFPSEPNPYEQLNFRPADNDVVLCSYPASGEDIVLKILEKLRDRDRRIFRTVGDSLGSIGSGLHVTHLPFCRSRWNPRARYVLLLRNPKQVCVSFYYLFKKTFQRLYGRAPEENCSFNTFYRLFVNGKVAYGDYFRHTRSWLERTCIKSCLCEERSSVPDTENLIILIYEEMENDLEHNLHRLIEFIDVDVDASRVSEEIKETLLRKQSLDCRDFSSSEGRRKKMGLAGGWESHFSKEHRTSFDEWVRWNGNASIYNKFWFDAL
ncbi:sulfotransferase 1C2A-like [Galendromus occidentalis]|uniref:Sulfotransferase 1C2A-like n=1 Tax=Galendromus occidentalis TaxID=34638 RepID=A0AAJ7WH62_9ACAR|nr:sulfotransferase 1C2A-like [Galendromus occidentalis]